MKKYILYSKANFLILCSALIFGCAPKFNKLTPTVKVAAAIAAAAQIQQLPISGAVQGFDANVSGGGAVGTSSSYRLSGVNVTPVVKKVGASSNNILKGGFQGQLSR